MDKEPLVSVVVPVYNVEQYLDCCVNSIVNQTYHNLEIILVDDGSTDSSGKLCDVWVRKDQRITVIHQENGGLSLARNSGIEVATGLYIAFVDSDDYLHKDYIRLMCDACLEYNAKLCVCEFENVVEDTPPHCNDQIVSELVYQDRLFEQLYSQRNVATVVAWNKLYSKELFDQIRYPIGRRHEDEATIHYLIEKVDYAVWLEYPLYYYRQTPNSITRTNYNLKMLDELWSKEVRLSFFSERGLTDLYQKALYVYCSRIIYHVSQLGKHNNQEYLNAASDYMKKYTVSYKALSKNNISVKQRMRLWWYYIKFINR